MLNTKQLIKNIRIKRFRSFGDEVIEAGLLNIYSGRNNVGKSNILKALNLFFNGMTDYDAPYSHMRDYNKAFRGAAGGRREILIEITFLPSGNGALKKEFSVAKRYYDGDLFPTVEYHSTDPKVQTEIEIKHGTITRQFTAFLNKIEYIYIPAVRDKGFIRKLLLNFENIIKSEASGRDFTDAMGSISTILNNVSSGISDDFEKYIGIPAEATLSTVAGDVLNATKINVLSGVQVKDKKAHGGKKEIRNIPIDLFSSGDGVVMAYLAYFLSYLTKKNRKNFIWGYEEPENSLEYSKVQELSEEFYNKFTKNAQIFITTHSPAFIDLRKREGVMFYRVFQRPLSDDDRRNRLPDKRLTSVRSLETISRQMSLFESIDPAYLALENELHMVEQAHEIQKAVDEARAKNEELREEVRKLRSALSKSDKLIVVTEGDNVSHIEHALNIIAPDVSNKIELLKGLEGSTGVDQLKKMYSYESAKKHGHALFVFDCDAAGKTESLEEKNGTFKYVFPHREVGDEYGVDGGIENLYPADVFVAGDFEENRILVNDGVRIERKLKKKDFLRKVFRCSDNDDGYFDGFSGLAEKIRNIIDSIGCDDGESVSSF